MCLGIKGVYKNVKIDTKIMKATSSIRGKRKALILILVLLLGIFRMTVNANGLENYESEYTTDYNNESNVEEMEEWMTDLEVWRNANQEALELEEEIELKRWMSEEFSKKEEDREDEIILEDWMVSPLNSYWNQSEEREEPVKLEFWMLNLSAW